jgi:hypothetical protein
VFHLSSTGALMKASRHPAAEQSCNVHRQWRLE